MKRLCYTAFVLFVFADCLQAADTPVVLEIPGNGSTLLTAVLSPDGKKVISTDANKTAHIWDAESGKELHILQHEEMPHAVAFSPDGTKFATMSLYNRFVRIWDIESGKELQALEGHKPEEKGKTGYTLSAHFLPEGDKIITVDGSNKTFRTWDAASGKELQPPQEFTELGDWDWDRFAVFSRDGRKVIVGYADHTARLWDIAEKKELHILKGHTPPPGYPTTASVRSAAFSPDETKIVTGGADGSVRIWDAASGRELHKLEWHGAWVGSVAFSPDGKKVAASGKVAHVWDVESGKELQRLEGHLGSVRAVAFSPDGKRLVVASNTVIRILDLELCADRAPPLYRPLISDF